MFVNIECWILNGTYQRYLIDFHSHAHNARNSATGIDFRCALPRSQAFVFRESTPSDPVCSIIWWFVTVFYLVQYPPSQVPPRETCSHIIVPSQCLPTENMGGFCWSESFIRRKTQVWASLILLPTHASLKSILYGKFSKKPVGTSVHWWVWWDQCPRYFFLRLEFSR